MSLTDFFHDAPVFATLLALGYIAILGIFTYMFVQMYKR